MPTPTEQQRIYARLAALSAADLTRIWNRLDRAKPKSLADPLAEVLSALIDEYGSAAATLAADWFDEAREAAGAPGSFVAFPAPPPTSEQVESLARWGIGPLFGADPNAVGALSLLLGGLQRQVLQMPRDTTEGSATLDPSGPLFARHASANACAFCRMLATRGAVYSSKDAALRVSGQSLGGTDYRAMRRGASRDSLLAGSRRRTVAQGGRKGRDTTQSLGDKYHDYCHCTAIAVWPGQDYPEAPYVAEWRKQYAAAVDTSKGEHGAIDVSKTLANWRADFDAN